MTSLATLGPKLKEKEKTGPGWYCSVDRVLACKPKGRKKKIESYLLTGKMIVDSGWTSDIC